MIFHFLFPIWCVSFGEERETGGQWGLRTWNFESVKWINAATGEGNWKFRVHFHSFLLNTRESLSRRHAMLAVTCMNVWDLKHVSVAERAKMHFHSSILIIIVSRRNEKRAKFPLALRSRFSSVRYWRVSFNSCDVLLFLWKLHASTTLNRQTSMLNWKLHLFHSLSRSSSLSRSPRKIPSITMNNRWWLFATTEKQPSTSHITQYDAEQTAEGGIEWTKQTEFLAFQITTHPSFHFPTFNSLSLHKASCKTVFSSNITSFRRKTCFRCMEWTI